MKKNSGLYVRRKKWQVRLLFFNFKNENDKINIV